MPQSVLRTVTINGQRVTPGGREALPLGGIRQRVAPGRKSDAEIGRDRKYLTPAEVETLVAAAKKRGRYGQRDAAAILVCYRHALRVKELVTLRWSQFDWATHRLTVLRLKGSISGVAHPVLADETRELKTLQRSQPTGAQFVFMGERGPVSVAWFQRMLQRVGADAGLPLVHPHQLRHAAGFALADKGRDLREIQLHLGHKAISNTTQYVELRPGRLDRIWD
jgi:integrase